MPHRSWQLASLLSLSLLVACGGGGNTNPNPGTTNPGTPDPGTPNPIPGSGTGSGQSSISGTVISAGALGPNQQAANITYKAQDSWWADPQAAAQRRSAGGDVVPGEFLVRLKPTLSAQSLGPLSVAGTALTQVRPLGLPGLYLYRSSILSAQNLSASQAAQQSQQLLSALNARPDVQYAEPNIRLYALKTPNDALLPLQWNIPLMNLPAAWDITTGSGTVVAVVDTGITKHPDLAGKLLPGADFVSDVSSAGDGDGYDTDPTDPGDGTEYHGTHVAGIVGAATNNGTGIAGVSWGARILPVRVLGKDGSGTLADILTGITWAAGGHIAGVPDNANPAKVINLSLGGPGACTQSEQAVFDSVNKLGVSVVVAAGNDNKDSTAYSPAGCNNVIVVGAVGPDASRAPYSNYGAKVDVMAPGGDMNKAFTLNGMTYPYGILSTIYDDTKKVFTYTFYQGTSMAAPHVAGLAALLISKNPDWTPAQVEAQLKATASPLSSTQCGVANGCGSGLVNASAALGGSSTPAPEPNPIPTPEPVTNGPTYVFAFYETADGKFDNARSPYVTLTNTTIRTPYTIQGAEAGSYTVAAWQDVNDNQKVDEGESLGVYPDSVVISSAASQITGIDVQLEPYSASASAAQASTPPRALAEALGRAVKNLHR